MEFKVISLFRWNRSSPIINSLVERRFASSEDAADLVYNHGWHVESEVQEWMAPEVKMTLDELIKEAESVEELEAILYSVLRYIEERDAARRSK